MALLRYNLNTAASDPGSGRIKAGATNLHLRISHTDKNGANIATRVASLDDIAHVQITIRSVATPTKFRIYLVKEALVNNGTYSTIPVEQLAGSGVWIESEELKLTVDWFEGAAGAISLSDSNSHGEPPKKGEGNIVIHTQAVASGELAKKGENNTLIDLVSTVLGILAKKGIADTLGQISVSVEGEKTEPIIFQDFTIKGNILYGQTEP